jgi:hypothetical protein
LSLHQHKISNDMLTAITGNKRHQMEYVSESYGGVKKSKPKQQPKGDDNKFATKKSDARFRETAADQGEPRLQDSFATQSTASDDEYLMDAV